MERRFGALACLLLCWLATACMFTPYRNDSRATDEARTAVTQALERYVTASRSVDADTMADFFTADATLFEPGIQPVVTRNAIRAFLKSFPGARVEVATATPDSIEVWEGTAIMWGSYFERLSFPGQPVSEQHGKFVIQWRREQDGAWLMERYFRVPLPDGASGTGR